MAHPVQKAVGLTDVACNLGVDNSTVLDWIASGKVRVSGIRDAATGEYRFTNDDLSALKAYGVGVIAESLFDEPNEWLDNPNPWLGGFTPRELVGTEREQLVFDVLQGIQHGTVA